MKREDCDDMKSYQAALERQRSRQELVQKHRKTWSDLLGRASNAIQREETIVFDVAAEHGQMVGNVGHMQWFLLAVAEQIANDYPKTWGHLLDKDGNLLEAKC